MPVTRLGLYGGPSKAYGAFGVVEQGVQASGRLTLNLSMTGDGQRLLEASGQLTLSGALSAHLFEGPQVNLIGQYQPEIHLTGSV